jgi:dTMP kinase
VKKGKLIVFAGGEGCGKSTCAQQLQKGMLPENDYLFTREPGGTERSEIVRDFFLKNELTAYEELLAVELARAIHFREKILPALCKGVHVISDRCCEATYAYQVYGKQDASLLKNMFLILDQQSRQNQEIDLWIDFSVNVEVALQRRLQERSEVNIFDSRPLEYHKRVREGLDEFFMSRKERVVTVDATLSEQLLAEKVCEFILHTCS